MKFYAIGDVTVDHLYFLERIPAPGEEVAPLRSNLLPGGAGATVAYYLAKLGHDVQLAARVGQDPFKDLALSQLKAAKVDLSAIQQDPDVLTSTITIMVTPDVERAMISWGGANRNLDAGELKKKDIDTSDALVVSAYSLIGGLQREYAVKAIAAAKKAKVPVFVDMGTGAVNAAGAKLLETVKTADYLLLNKHELSMLTGEEGISEALSGLRRHGIHQVVVKLGAFGSIVWTPEETELIEAFEVDGVVDSTGAGDAFTAAFASAILDGQDIRKAARYANLVGALVATNVGAQTTKISHEDIVKRLKN